MPKIASPSRIYVNRGDHVKQGQLLATLESRDLTPGAEGQGAMDQANPTCAPLRARPSRGGSQSADRLEADKQAMDPPRRCSTAAAVIKEGALAGARWISPGELHAGKSPVRCAQASAGAASRRQRGTIKTGLQWKSAKAHHQSSRPTQLRAHLEPIGGVMPTGRSTPVEMATRHAAARRDDISRVVARSAFPQASRHGKWPPAPLLRSIAGGSAGKVIVVSPPRTPQHHRASLVEAENPAKS